VAAGNYAEAGKLAAEIYPTLVSWGLHGHGLAAWLVLQNALDLRELDGLLTRIRLYFLRHWPLALGRIDPPLLGRIDPPAVVEPLI
jgi:hypothetical protein